MVNATAQRNREAGVWRVGFGDGGWGGAASDEVHEELSNSGVESVGCSEVRMSRLDRPDTCRAERVAEKVGL